MLSPDSTSTEPEDNPGDFRTFFRASASDSHLVDAVVQLLHDFRWRFIQVVHSGDSSGRKGAETLTRLARAREICVRSRYVTQKGFPTQNRGVNY